MVSRRPAVLPCFLIAIVTLVAGCAGSDPVDAFVGTWSMSTSFSGGGELAATMALDRGDAGMMRGTWTSQGMEMELEDIAISGSDISFNRAIPGGAVARFEGRRSNGTLEGTWTGPFGEARCSGERLDAPASAGGGIPDLHDRPIRNEDGRTLLWASGEDDEPIEWFDMTGAAIDPHMFQFGIGKDTIASIDEPRFARFDDPLVAERGVDRDTEVLGVYVDGVARAYPVDVMSIHEVVNDDIAGKPYAVIW